MNLRSVLLLILILLFAAAASCSSSGKKRPFGYMHLGPVNKLLAPETFLEQKGILLRRDDSGFYAMSTYCTHDLSRLAIKKENGVAKFISRFSKSTYDLKGNVLTGPAKAPLPFYQLEMAVDYETEPNSIVEVKVNNLYVIIGKRVSSDWRLEVPTIKSES